MQKLNIKKAYVHVHVSNSVPKLNLNMPIFFSNINGFWQNTLSLTIK